MGESEDKAKRGCGFSLEQDWEQAGSKAGCLCFL